MLAPWPGIWDCTKQGRRAAGWLAARGCGCSRPFIGGKRLGAVHGRQADQLHRLFCTLGMPRDELWPQGLPHWPTVQRWRAADYPDADALPSALGTECGPALLSLLRGLLRLNPACRCTAKDALAHAFCRPTDPAAAPAVGDDDVAHISHESAVT